LDEENEIARLSEHFAKMDEDYRNATLEHQNWEQQNEVINLFVNV